MGKSVMFLVIEPPRDKKPMAFLSSEHKYDSILLLIHYDFHMIAVLKMTK